MARQEGRMPSSVLQVVRNPSWLTPYIGCMLVAAGLVIQFMSHLIKFLSAENPRRERATHDVVNGAVKTARAEKRNYRRQFANEKVAANRRNGP